MGISICWLRRDLRIDDNSALFYSLKSGLPVLPVFIFDAEILSGLDSYDKRLIFIYDTIRKLKLLFESAGSTLLVMYGKPEEVFVRLFGQFQIESVFAGIDYEPYSIERDKAIEDLCSHNAAGFHRFHDHVIYAPKQILKPDGKPYHVFTPYSKNWMLRFKSDAETNYPSEDLLDNLLKHPPTEMPDSEALKMVWKPTEFPVSGFNTQLIEKYDKVRDFPALDATTHLGIHLRFGTVSVRKLARLAYRLNQTFLNELIWREFYQMILYHHPEVVTRSFKPVYDNVRWLNREQDFDAWCAGKTGYPLVDAGMRQLTQTGFMHNRVRMITASFLTKHLLIDWRWGEAFFAGHLLDYELASNNGGWQWAASSGCDAVPYFRIFSPARQQQTFDANEQYIRKWLPEYSSAESYLKPIIEHTFARERAIGIFASLNKT
jgi:deoxyribodipyrimidine photo-lyase